jgi:inositol-pentakisphosphate 2-kinase
MTDAHELIHLSETKPSDWKYIAEGGSTLVLAYDGDQSSSKFTQQVLRLRKSDIHVVFEESPEFWSEPDDPIIQFQAEVVEKLLPYDCLPHFRVVTVDRSWLEKLAELVEPHRPEARRKKDQIDLTRHKAVLATDLIGGHGWSVEIKVW